ncbi:MAG TPA: D-aminoacylase [Gemmatimonadales bacterium]
MKFLKAAATAAAFLVALPGYRPAADFDLLITGGTVIDGTGAPGRRADVGINADRIVAIGDLAGRGAARTIDAHGLVVAPGFIDMLGWSQITILVDNRGVSKVTQGITTEITGEGWSPAPTNDNTLKPDAAQYAAWGLTVDWHDLDGYFHRLERSGTPFNLATFVGATTLRLYVMGEAHRAPNEDEMARMEALADTAMRQGALGLSTALIYEPGSYAKAEELIALAKVAARHGGIYASHIRSEGIRIRPALDEAFRIGHDARLPVEVWHLKLSGRPYWGHMREIIARFDRQRAGGDSVGANSYPYVASATGLSQVLPAWARVGGDSVMIERLRDPAARARIKREVKDASGVMVLATLDPTLSRFQGRRISEIAESEHKAQLDVVMDLLVADKGKTGAAYFSMSEDDVTRAVATPWIGVGSDFGATAPDGPLFAGPVHPRAYGTFPRILGHYVRDLHALTLEAAVHKMTGVAAERVGLKDRGQVREGYFADLAIFDPATVADRATFESPHQIAAGIRYVLVNGRLTMDDGRLTTERPGRALRGPGYNP